MLFVDANLCNTGLTNDKGITLAERGSVIDASEMQTRYGANNALGYTVALSDAFSTVVAHEITHLLIEPGVVGLWNADEHIDGPLATYEDDLMYKFGTDKNRALATVTFSELLQKELKVKSNQGITQ